MRASQGTQQAINRLSTAWTDLKKAFADSGPADSMTKSFGGLTQVLDGVTEGMRRAKAEHAGFVGQMAGGLEGAFSSGGSVEDSKVVGVSSTSVGTPVVLESAIGNRMVSAGRWNYY